MTSPHPWHFLLVCEDMGHAWVAGTLGDRVALEAHAWLDGILDDVRVWRGADTAHFLPWTAVERLRREHHVPRVRGFGGGNGRRAVQTTLRVASALPEPPALVVLLKDSDGDATLAAVLREARDAFVDSLARHPFDVVIGVAHPEVEAWLLGAFRDDVLTSDEGLRWAEVRKTGGPDPRQHGEVLTAGRTIHKRDAKRILGTLLAVVPEKAASNDRARAVFRSAPLAVLEAVGAGTGLADLIEELRQRLPPCFVRPPATPTSTLTT